MASEGVVYVLTNPAMPGLVKIGKTGRGVETRLNDLVAPINSGLFGAGVVNEVEVDQPEPGFFKFTLTEAGIEARMQSVVSPESQTGQRACPCA